MILQVIISNYLIQSSKSSYHSRNKSNTPNQVVDYPANKVLTHVFKSHTVIYYDEIQVEIKHMAINDQQKEQKSPMTKLEISHFVWGDKRDIKCWNLSHNFSTAT